MTHNWQAYSGSVAEDYHRHLVEGLFLPWAIELVELAGSSLAQTDPERFKRLVADLSRELEDQINEEGLSDPIESNLLTARA